MQNQELLDPFAQDYPETVIHTIPDYQTSCIKFTTTHLAAGTVSGIVVIFDLLILGPARILKGHTRTVQSVTWSKCGRYLLSASRDWLCIIWDLATSSILHKIKFEAPVWMSDLSPDSSASEFILCASLLDSPAYVVRCSKTGTQIIPLVEAETSKSKGLVLCSIFTHGGEYIIGGTTKGSLCMWDTQGQLLNSWRLTSGSVKSISASPSAPPYLVTNSTDRIVRTLPLPHPEDTTIETEHKFQDVVNRLQWNATCFSSSAEYVCASTYQSANDVYIWERQRGSLVKILEGPKEEMIDIAWHPNQVLVGGVGVESGAVYLWGVRTEEKWGSFAPDFKELEENVEYEEREDEFDIRPEEETGERRVVDETADIDLEGNLYGQGDEPFVLRVDLDDVLLVREAAEDANEIEKSVANKQTVTLNGTNVKRKRNGP